MDFLTKQKLNNDHEKLNNLDSMGDLILNTGWSDVGFNKAVMSSEFAQLDLINTLQYGRLISERLKEAIEFEGITGVKIEECPVQFEINDDWGDGEKAITVPIVKIPPCLKTRR